MQAGANFLGTGADATAIEIFSQLGLSLEIPLISAPKDLGSSISFSLMWGHDMSSALRANHFVTIYTGLNLLELLAAQGSSN